LSSILKALKKIEEQAPPPETFPSLPLPIDSRHALNSDSLKRRRVGKALVFLILLIGAGVAAGFFISQRRMNVAKTLPIAATSNTRDGTAQTPPANKIYRAEITDATEKSARLRSVQKGQQQNHQKSPVTGSSGNKFQAKPSSAPSGSAAVQREVKSPSLRPAARAELKAKVENPLAKTPTVLGAAPTEKSVARKENAPMAPGPAAAKKRSAPPATAAYDRVEDSKLKLQALAWSADDARRMAVINGRIVREGESVDGYQVMQIREEDVVVNDGGKSWRLEFGMRR